MNVKLSYKIITIILLSFTTLVIGIMFSPAKTKAWANNSNQTENLDSKQLHLATKATSFHNSDKVNITVLTHGMAGRSYNWSNGMHRDEEFDWIVPNGMKLEYDPESIIEKIREKANGIKIFEGRFLGDSEEIKMFLYEHTFHSQQNIYIRSDVDLLTQDDFLQHVVLIFDSNDNMKKRNDKIYEELDYMIDKVSYDFLMCMGSLPKINLIGHSRGGLINMDYAIEHPKNVASLISLGTPYNGSFYDNDLTKSLGIDSFTKEGGEDIVDPNLIAIRKNNWNAVYAQNKHINFHAISGTTSFTLMRKIIYGGYVDRFPDYVPYLPALRATFTALTIHRAGIMFNTALRTGPFVLLIDFDFQILPGDVCVDRSSQAATGYNGVMTFNKKFTAANSNFDKIATDDLPVPHNLQTYDVTLHKYILSNIQLGNGALYDTTDLGDDAIRINSLTREYNGALIVPSIINGRQVLSIAEGAFANRTGITSITIPLTIASVGKGILAGCTNLISLTTPTLGEFIPLLPSYLGYLFGANSTTYQNAYIPRTLKIVAITRQQSIKDSSFEGCTNIENISLPEGLTSIGKNAFYNCRSLTDIEIIGNQPVIIESSAFRNCVNMINLEIPDNVTSIGEGAFQNCYALSSIFLPFIGNGSNYNHFGYVFGAPSAHTQSDYVPESLNSVIITGGSEVGYEAFKECRSLKNISLLSPALSLVSENAFYECKELETIDLPIQSEIEIGSYAFYGCSKLVSIEIPPNVISIGRGALLGCNSLNDISIPFVGSGLNNNTHFGYIFGASTNINQNNYLPESLIAVEITGGSEINRLAFRGCFNLQVILLPNSLTNIGEAAFFGCVNLQEIYIPANVKLIDDQAFYGCSNLKAVYLNRETRSQITLLGEYVFEDCASLRSIYVPSLTDVAAYKRLTSWSAYHSLIKSLPLIAR